MKHVTITVCLCRAALAAAYSTAVMAAEPATANRIVGTLAAPAQGL